MNTKKYQLMSVFVAFILVFSGSYSTDIPSTYGLSISQSQMTTLLAFPDVEGFGANTLGGRGGSVYEIANTNDSSSRNQRSLIEATTPTSGPTRPMKYYGVDRGSPFTDANYAILAQHAVKTIIVDTFINDASNGASAKWSNIKALAAKYNFDYVIWPNQGGDVPGCGWETPFNSPQNGDYIWRVTTILDSFATDPHFIGMISAHEPMWNTSTCKTSISDMASIKTQLKNYMQAKGRTDFKVWNYIDNISDLRDMPGFVNADIERVMDVAVTWQHCFGGAEGTCSAAKNKIIADRALINNAGLNGKVDLVYLFQTFATGGGYSMPTLADMQTWDCQFIATNALDGFIYYTWGAWYSTDLINHPELWPEMNRVYDSCIDQTGPLPTSTPTVKPTNASTVTPDKSAPTVVSSVRNSVNPTSAANVDFTVTFSEAVTGINTVAPFNNFDLTITGSVSGASITGVVGIGSVYTITVNTGSGDGTIRLDIPVSAIITDLAGNSLDELPYISGQTYIINRFPVPNAPVLRSPRNNLITNDTTPTFWWTSVKGGQSYEIMFAADSVFTSNVNTKMIVGSSYTAAPALGSGIYYWHVRGYNASNQPGVWSSTRTFTIDTTGPSAPVLSSPANNTSSNRTPTFKWLSVPTAVLYEFQYDGDSVFVNPIYTVSIRSTFRRPPALKPGTYHWHVRAKDASGNWGLWSTTWTLNIISP